MKKSNKIILEFVLNELEKLDPYIIKDGSVLVNVKELIVLIKEVLSK